MADHAALPNGDSSALHPHSELELESPRDISHNKRKRDEDHADPATTTISATRVQQLQQDILQVLERHDTVPSFLNCLFGNAAAEEPSMKKARLSEAGDEPLSIGTKLSSTAYTSLQQIKVDAAIVAEQLISAVRNKAKERDANASGRPSVDELKQIHKIQAFEALIQDTADKEAQYVMAHEQTVEPTTKKDKVVSNGNALGKSTAGTGRNGTVLTLFGNAPTPKQLFSSMQNPAPANAAIKSELPVEEMSLPNGIAATKVTTGPEPDAKKGPTFEEAFPPPYNLAPLQPPKAHKRSSTRDLAVTWEFKDLIQRQSKKGGYTVQSLSVGSWLSYGGKETLGPDAKREKRKQRERALSSSASEAPDKLDASEQEEALAKEEEALFRRAYSSFAPSVDNANAVVPEETKDLVWWQKVGNRRYHDTFAIDPALLDETEPSFVPFEHVTDAGTDGDNFDKIVEDLDALDDFRSEYEPARSKTDAEQVLREISELLETLASHQRNRNATLATPTFAKSTPLSPAPIVASKLGKPDEPSDEEVNTYNNLRREIAYLILKLPPYAVAKLDGDQLAELQISKLISFQNYNVRGVMEEDFVTRQAKAQAQATAASIASLARPNSSAGQHYSTTANRTPAIGQAANTRYGQQYGAKAPSVPQFQRQASNTQSYGTPGATGARPAYTQPNQYTRPSAPSGGFGQSQSTQYYQRPPQQTPGAFGGFGQTYQQTPQSQQRYTPQTQQYQSQQRSATQIAAANATGYQTHAAAQLNRTASPAKSAGFPAVSMAPNAMQQATAPRPTYPAQPGSGRATPNNYPSQPHTPVNGFRPPQTLQPRPTSATPQPSAYAPPPVGAVAATNGTSPAPRSNDLMQGMISDPETGTWMCSYCDEHLGSSQEARHHKCNELKCKKCGRQYVYREVFKKHRDSCTG